jgi:hypothetical protein
LRIHFQLKFQRNFALRQLESADEETLLEVEEYRNEGYKKKLEAYFEESPDDDEKIVKARQKQKYVILPKLKKHSLTLDAVPLTICRTR